MKLATVGFLLSVLSFAAGAAAYGWFAARSLGGWNLLVQVNFAIEQEARATRAERRGDLLEALHRRWNVVDAKSREGWLRDFETWKPPSLLFPLYFATLRKMWEAGDPSGRGSDRLRGIAHGQLAHMLEVNGQPDRAAPEWKTATALNGYPDEARTRKLIELVRKTEANKFQVQLEDAVLGPSRE